MREWWIEFWEEKPDSPLIQERPVSNRKFDKCQAADELVHVVEKSAYDELKAEYEALKDSLTECLQSLDAKS